MGQILTVVKPLNKSHLRAIAKCPLNRSLAVYSSATSESPPISIWLHREQLVWGYRKKSPKVASRFYICSVGKSFSAAAVYSRRRLGRQVRKAVLQFRELGLIPRWHVSWICFSVTPRSTPQPNLVLVVLMVYLELFVHVSGEPLNDQ